MTDVQLEAAVDAAGAMIFARPEDGAFNPNKDDEYFFVTTAGSAGGADDGANSLGALYSLRPASGQLRPRSRRRSRVVYNADDVVAAGGDIAISPDNIDASAQLPHDQRGRNDHRAAGS